MYTLSHYLLMTISTYLLFILFYFLTLIKSIERPKKYQNDGHVFSSRRTRPGIYFVILSHFIHKTIGNISVTKFSVQKGIVKREGFIFIFKLQ